MEEAVSAGKVRSIGICNFSQQKLTEITSQATIMPAVSQVECHPYFQQRELKAFLEQFGTVLESWYPIGHGNQRLLSEPLFAELGRKYGKSPVQVILRWQIQDGNIAIPKSTNPAHIQSNIELFDFELTPEEMERIAALDTPKTDCTTCPHSWNESSFLRCTSITTSGSADRSGDEPMYR